MFYSTIFATAMVLDAKSKTDRRLQREKEIEAVKAEVKQLEEEEARIVDSLSRRRWRPVPRMARVTTRQYTTIANPAADYERYRETAARSAEERPMQDTGFEAQWTPNEDIEDAKEEISDYYYDEGINPHRKRAVKLLAMRMLGVRLLLRPSIAHTYGAISGRRAYCDPLPGLTVDDLLEELGNIQRRIFKIKNSADAYYGDIASELTLDQHALLLKEGEAAAYSIQKLVLQFEDRQLAVDMLMARIAQILLSCREPLGPKAVSILINAFCKARLNDIVKMIMDSLFINSFPLTTGVIISALNWFNQSKNLSGFDRFLQLLQTPDPFVSITINWRYSNIGGVEVPVPPHLSPNPFIYNSLISCALNFDQPQRADAWLDALRSIGYSDTVPVLASYLRYYSFRADWRKGRHVLMRAVVYLLSSTNSTVHEVERLILFMITFCQCCNKHGYADSIIDAAVESGISWENSARENDSRPALLWALRRWRDAATEGQIFIGDGPYGQIYVEFARMVEPAIRKAVEEFIPEDDLTLHRLRLEESFNLKYYKLLSDHGKNDHGKTRGRPRLPQTGVASVDDINATKAELKRLQGMLKMQSALIEKLHGVLSTGPVSKSTGLRRLNLNRSSRDKTDGDQSEKDQPEADQTNGDSPESIETQSERSSQSMSPRDFDRWGESSFPRRIEKHNPEDLHENDPIQTTSSMSADGYLRSQATSSK